MAPGSGSQGVHGSPVPSGCTRCALAVHISRKSVHPLALSLEWTTHAVRAGIGMRTTVPQICKGCGWSIGLSGVKPDFSCTNCRLPLCGDCSLECGRRACEDSFCSACSTRHICVENHIEMKQQYKDEMLRQWAAGHVPVTPWNCERPASSAADSAGEHVSRGGGGVVAEETGQRAVAPGCQQARRVRFADQENLVSTVSAAPAASGAETGVGPLMLLPPRELVCRNCNKVRPWRAW